MPGCLGEPAWHARGLEKALESLFVGATDKHTEILGTVEVYFSFDFALNSLGLVLFIIIELPAFEDLGRSVCIDVI